MAWHAVEFTSVPPEYPNTQFYDTAGPHLPLPGLDPPHRGVFDLPVSYPPAPAIASGCDKKNATLHAFHVTADRGFLPRVDPVTTLPAAFSPLESLLQRLPIRRADGTPGLLASQSLIDAVFSELPDLSEEIDTHVADLPLMLALYRDYSFLATAFLFEPCFTRRRSNRHYGVARMMLPPCIARPLVKLAPFYSEGPTSPKPFMEHLGSLALYNWLSTGGKSVAPIRWFEDNRPGSWEAEYTSLYVNLYRKSTGLVAMAVKTITGAANANVLEMKWALERLEEVLKEINGLMKDIWVSRIAKERPSFATFLLSLGSPGMFPCGVSYEGVREEAYFFTGENGAHDILFATAAAVLQIPTPSSADLPELTADADFHAFRPGTHGKFLSWLSGAAAVFNVRSTAIADLCAADAYARCVDQVRSYQWRLWSVQKEASSSRSDAVSETTEAKDLNATLEVLIALDDQHLLLGHWEDKISTIRAQKAALEIERFGAREAASRMYEYMSARENQNAKYEAVVDEQVEQLARWKLGENEYLAKRRAWKENAPTRAERQERAEEKNEECMHELKTREAAWAGDKEAARVIKKYDEGRLKIIALRWEARERKAKQRELQIKGASQKKKTEEENRKKEEAGKVKTEEEGMAENEEAMAEDEEEIPEEEEAMSEEEEDDHRMEEEYALHMEEDVLLRMDEEVMTKEEYSRLRLEEAIRDDLAESLAFQRKLEEWIQRGDASNHSEKCEEAGTQLEAATEANDDEFMQPSLEGAAGAVQHAAGPFQSPGPSQDDCALYIDAQVDEDGNEEWSAADPFHDSKQLLPTPAAHDQDDFALESDDSPGPSQDDCVLYRNLESDEESDDSEHLYSPGPSQDNCRLYTGVQADEEGDDEDTNAAGPVQSDLVMPLIVLNGDAEVDAEGDNEDQNAAGSSADDAQQALPAPVEDGDDDWAVSSDDEDGASVSVSTEDNEEGGDVSRITEVHEDGDGIEDDEDGDDVSITISDFEAWYAGEGEDYF